VPFLAPWISTSDIELMLASRYLGEDLGVPIQILVLDPGCVVRLYAHIGVNPCTFQMGVTAWQPVEDGVRVTSIAR
jgi:hypothetical protein